MSMRLTLLTRAMVLVVGVTLAPSGHATVNSELVRRDPFGDGWSGFIQVSLALAKGNVDYVNVGGAAMAQWQSLWPKGAGETKDALPWIRHRAFVKADGRFAETPAGPYISNAFAHARWTAMWHRRVGTELFSQFQFNDFLRLSRRALGGIGARAEVLHIKPLQISIGTAYMLEYEKIEVEEGANDEAETLAHRWTTYLTLRASLFDGQLLVQNTIYVQPRLDRLSDLRVLNTLDLSVGVTKHLSFGTQLSFLHDSRPPTGVKSDDVRLSTNIRVSL